MVCKYSTQTLLHFSNLWLGESHLASKSAKEELILLREVAVVTVVCVCVVVASDLVALPDRMSGSELVLALDSQHGRKRVAVIFAHFHKRDGLLLVR